eukprot:TRINITY_DN7417_c0_g1_i1.p2 TRINITY_DN7417_c0_g1~~TRINITY_DN7417_c0_g1_i1.p2  ORF type:complete len:117 (+),score=25.80 TRINITY_DN7417_c0_g1_i1:27-353(+)
MGNIQPNSRHIPTTYSNISVSNRSKPIDGFVVEREAGIVLGSSSLHSLVDAQQSNAAMQLALQQMTAAAVQLGANAVLAMRMEVKEFGEKSRRGITQCYGTAVVVRRQ